MLAAPELFTQRGKGMGIVNYILRRQEYVWEIAVDHIEMAAWSIMIAIIVGVLMGIVIARYRPLARIVVGIVNIIQTVPALALFALLMPFLGIGAKAGITALTMYAILPILKNTFAGITGVETSLIETGRGIGMTEYQLLTKVQLPLAVPVIMAGIRTAAVIAVGMTTLVALIGGSGLGKIIYRGISRVDNNEIMAGAVLAAGMAIIADILLGRLERRMRWDARQGGDQ